MTLSGSKLALDLGMTAVSLAPGVGWIAGAAYFGGKAILETSGYAFWRD